MVRRAAAIAVWLVLSASTLHAQDVVFTVTATSASVYKAPSIGSVAIGQAPRGRSFAVTRELGSWVRVAWPGGDDGVGYLHVTWGTLTRGGLSPVSVRSTFDTTPGSRSAAAAAAVAQQPLTRTQSAPAPVLLPSHVIGVGGRMGSEAFGFAGTARAWSRGPLGMQLEVSRSTRTSLVATERASTMQFAPSVIYSPRDFLTSAVWVRPYLGGGVTLSRSTRDTLAVDESGAIDGGLGYQGFGGAELTWANLPQLAFSADLRRQWTPVPFGDTRDARFGVALSVHWYLK